MGATQGLHRVTASLSALDAGFVFAVAGGAAIVWWLGFVVAAAWMVALVVIHERRAPEVGADA